MSTSSDCNRCETPASRIKFVRDKQFSTPWCCPKCGNIMFKFRPMKDLVCVYPIPLPDTFIPGGTVLRTESSRDVEKEWGGRSPYGIILNFGPGYRDGEGVFHPTHGLEVGDVVIYDKGVPNRLRFEGFVDHLKHLVVVCGFRDVGAVIEDFNWDWKGLVYEIPK